PGQPGEQGPAGRVRRLHAPAQRAGDLGHPLRRAQYRAQRGDGPGFARGADVGEPGGGAGGVVQLHDQLRLEHAERGRDHAAVRLAQHAPPRPYVSLQEIEAERGVGIVGGLAPVADHRDGLDGVAQPPGRRLPARRARLGGTGVSYLEEGLAYLGIVHGAHYPSAGNAVVLRYLRPRAFCTVGPRAGTGPVVPEESEAAMAGKAVISLTTGLEDPEKVTVAFLVAVGAAEAGRPTLMFQAKEA